MIFPSIDPIIIQVGPIALRWYAVSYVAGILLGWYYIDWLSRKYEKPPISQKAYDDIVIWAIIGILFGGRIGYVIFYNPSYYFSNPSDIIAVWKGGMSFHGGLIGVITSLYLMCRFHKLRFLAVMDIVACATPIGLFLGRIANFINAELYGRITDVPWGVIFPGDPFARHPSQIYESLLEGALLFIIMRYLVLHTNIRRKTGALCGVFLLGYSIFRAFAELFRQPDHQIGFIMGTFTMGQILSIPMIFVGIYLIFFNTKDSYKKHSDKQP